MKIFDNAINEVDLTIRAIQDKRKVLVKLKDNHEKREHLNAEISEGITFLASKKNGPELTAMLNTLQGKHYDEACA